MNSELAWVSYASTREFLAEPSAMIPTARAELPVTVDTVPGFLCTMTARGQIEFVNQALLDYTGWSLEQLADWRPLLHPDEREMVMTRWMRAVETGDPYDIEHRIRGADGAYRWFVVRGLPVKGAEGSIDRWYVFNANVDELWKTHEKLQQSEVFLAEGPGVNQTGSFGRSAVRDITERTRSEGALSKAQDDLARIDRATIMGELTASLAHEVSQPISGAITNANICLQSLDRDQPDLDLVRRAVTRIARDAHRAKEIIKRIRSQFRRDSPHREIVDVNEVNRETVALLRDEAIRYNVSVRMELAGDLPPILGDRVQLQQVAMNLIVNGIEAMNGVDGVREILIKSQPADDDQILVSISDTGVGFPPELAEQIFAPFFTTKPNGTGMGLRISRSIIDSLGGRLWAVSTSGCGSTFYITLPTARSSL